MASGNGNMGTAEMAEMAEMAAGSRLSCYDLAALGPRGASAPASHEVQMHLVSYVLQFDLRVTKDTVRTQTTSEER